MPRMIATSWDDGLMSDMPLLLILEQLGIKATFALTPGRYTASRRWNSAAEYSKAVCIGLEQLADYNHHDVWSHSNLHIRNNPDVAADYITAKVELERVYKREISGLCFPYGDVSTEIIGAAKEAGYRWLRAGRHTQSTLEGLIFPRCHWKDSPSKVRDTVKEHGYAVVAGHTYELSTLDDWRQLYNWYKELAAEVTTLSDLCKTCGL